MRDITDIIGKYTDGKATLEDTNAALKEAGAGFGTETNHLLLISDAGVHDLPMMTKAEAADELLSALNLLLKKKNSGKGGTEI